jgi:vacuolar-type H+-ATPase subunit H
LYLDVTANNINYQYYSNDWFDWDMDNDWPLFGANLDSIMLNTVRIDVVKSNDNDFRMTKVKFSRGINPVVARNIAEKINFQTTQADSILYLPKGFSISKNERWRAQQVLLILQVPVGKRFFLDRSISKYNWFDVRYNRRGGIDVDDNWERTYGVESGKEYIMSPDGPKKIEDLDTDALNRGEYKEREREEVNEDARNRKLDELKRNEEKIEEEKQKLLNKGRRNRTDTTGGYRYHQKAPANKTDSTPAKVNASV